MEPASVIPVLLPLEMRPIVYFAPAMVTITINFIALAKKGNLKNTLNILKDYPQVILSSGFTPFFFKWQTVYHCDSALTQQQKDTMSNNADGGVLQLTICKRASFVNAIAIGCLPQAALIISLLKRGAHTWDFSPSGKSRQYTTTLFPMETGAMAFAIGSFLSFSVLITVFFKSHKMCGKCGVHCIFKNVMCCPCPNACLIIKPHHIHTKSALTDMQLVDMNVVPALNRNVNNEVAPLSEIYIYHGCMQIVLLHELPQPQLTQAAGENETKQVRHCKTYACCIQDSFKHYI